MPANGRRDLIRRLKFNTRFWRRSDLYPLKPSGKHMYHQILFWNFSKLPTQCMLFPVSLKITTIFALYYIHPSIFLMEALPVLCAVWNIRMCNVDSHQSSKGELYALCLGSNLFFFLISKLMSLHYIYKIPSTHQNLNYFLQTYRAALNRYWVSINVTYIFFRWLLISYKCLRIMVFVSAKFEDFTGLL